MYLLFNDCKDIGSLLYSSGSFDEHECSFELTIRKAYEIAEENAFEEELKLKDFTYTHELLMDSAIDKLYKLSIKAKAFDLYDAYQYDDTTVMYILEVM